jgi:hypothetical protein
MTLSTLRFCKHINVVCFFVSRYLTQQSFMLQ